MKFNHLVLLDNTGLRDWAIEELSSLAKKVTVYHDYPASESAVMERVGDADGVLVSLHTKLNSNIIQHFANVKYIGMCCSLYSESSSNVSISAAREKNIMVKGIKDYGDEGVIEFILSELIRLAKGLGAKQWKEEPAPVANATGDTGSSHGSLAPTVFPTTPEELEAANRLRRIRRYRRCHIWTIVAFVLAIMTWMVPVLATVLLVIILFGVALVTGCSSTNDDFTPN